MTTDRRLARCAGVLYLVTHVTSIGAVVLYGGASFTPGAQLPGRCAMVTGALLEVILALSVLGTGVLLYPLLRSRSSAVAASYAALRTLEASVILAGVVMVLPVVARPGSSGGGGLSAQVDSGLLLMHDWAFLVGPGLVAPVHTVVLALMLRRYRLVPAFIPWLGMVGGPIIAVMNLLVMYGVAQVQPLLTLPIWAWEVSLAIHLIARGLPAQAGGTGRAAAPLESTAGVR